ncbi:MAG TPA: CocE/NonD family hydrolase [Anaerolineales bacterium]|nr:CocE/NonD family hydrolase [Anaerolineales bacterium]
MKKRNWKRMALAGPAAILLIFGLIYVNQGKARDQMISEFGKYQGYTRETYDGTQRTSDYVTLSDGTRLAYDLIIPTRKGVPADKPLPVLFKYTPYGRTWTIFDRQGKFLLGDFVDLPTQIMARLRYLVMGDPGRIMDPLQRDKWLGTAVRHGYIVVSVDRPATGASFRSPTPGSMETASRFENEIIDWIVAQPWSDGNVAMYGDSQNAMVQFAAAAALNPHLKAILPAASDIQIYQSTEWPGGVFNTAFAAQYDLVPLLDKMATPVDSDPDGVLLAQAFASRQSTLNVQNAAEVSRQAPYQDSATPDGTLVYKTMDLYPFIDRINRSHTAIYMTVGWADIFTADMFFWYNNLSVPKRLTIRPTDHSQVCANLADLDYGAESLRWLDYWLKGVDNGIMDEPPIHYYLQDGARGGSWQTADQWPLAAQKAARFYFGPGRSGSVSSANDGLLLSGALTSSSAYDTYTVDYSTTTGPKSRWAAVDAAHDYPDMRANDAKALTYTTAPLESGAQVTGHPVVHLWLSTAAPDLDVFAYLEEVDPGGRSTYVTEGDLRASHRKLSPAPFNNFGLPYQSHLQGDQLPLPDGKPFELAFSLLPSSFQFHIGDRIRITVAFADTGNFDTPVLEPPPTLQLLRNPLHPSYVEIPILHDP